MLFRITVARSPGNLVDKERVHTGTSRKTYVLRINLAFHHNSIEVADSALSRSVLAQQSPIVYDTLPRITPKRFDESSSL